MTPTVSQKQRKDRRPRGAGRHLRRLPCPRWWPHKDVQESGGGDGFPEEATVRWVLEEERFSLQSSVCPDMLREAGSVEGARGGDSGRQPRRGDTGCPQMRESPPRLSEGGPQHAGFTYSCVSHGGKRSVTVLRQTHRTCQGPPGPQRAGNGRSRDHGALTSTRARTPTNALTLFSCI